MNELFFVLSRKAEDQVPGWGLGVVEMGRCIGIDEPAHLPALPLSQEPHLLSQVVVKGLPL